MFETMNRPSVRTLLVIGALLLSIFLVFNSLASVNHDESQYAAAAVLSADYLIYRDFMSNQPPLHAWVFAPIAALFGDWAFIGMRVATSALALLTAILVYLLQRRLSVSVGHAVLVTGALVCTQAFLFASGLVRNDMLPAALSAGGMVLLAKPSGSYAKHIAAGLLFGLAVSAKVSWSPVALAAFLYVVYFRRKAVAPIIIGGVLGSVPLLVTFWIAPAGFLYGVLEHGATAPFDWYQQTGEAEKLTWRRKIGSVVYQSWWGAAPVAALAIAFFAVTRWKKFEERHWFLAILCVGGLIGALIPTPTHEQYLIPLYVALFPLYGLVLSDIPSRRAAIFLTILASVYGSITTVKRIWNNTTNGVTAFEMRSTANWIDDEIGKTGQEGTIATLSAHLVTGIETKLDRGFATGPFVYRSGSLLSPSRARDLNTMIPARLNEPDFRPVAVLTGGEPEWGRAPSPDSSLDAFAASQGYRLLRVPDTGLRLWLRDKK